ncbi:MAG TPA: PAS domain S-box protein [Bacteroidota bacterium]|nr:PAS domain S-box protein [Bacteroidota bacterium]
MRSRKKTNSTNQLDQAIFETASDGIFVLNRRGRLLAVNRQGCRMSGYSRAELLRKNVRQLIPAADLRKSPLKFKELAEGKIVRIERRFRRKNGTLITVEFSARMLPNGNFLALARDITERKRLTDELVKRESALRTTLYSIGDAVITTDIRGCVTMMNPIAEELTGWSEKNARGKPLSRIFRIINEETRAKVQNPVERILKEGIVVGLANHTLLISRDGEERPIADAGAPIRDAAGKIAGVVLVFRDQTEERRVQNALRDAREFAESIVETVREPLLVLDERLEVVAANRSFYRTFKATPRETIGRKLYNLGNRQWNIPKLRALLEDILPSNSHFDDFEVTQDFERIGTRTMVLNARRLFREANRSRLILLAIEDITERKRIQEQLRQILENSTNLFYSHTTDHVLTYLSPQTRNFLGCEPDEAMVRWTEFATDHAVNAKGFALTEKAIQTGKPQPPYELELRKVTGETIWVEVHEAPVVKEGKVVAIVGSLTDITERRKAEQAAKEREEWFRRLADTTSTAIFLYQGEHNVYANRAAEKLTGYSREELVTMKFWEVVHPEVREVIRQRGLARQQGADLPVRYEVKILRKDGAERWVDFTAGKIDWQGKPAVIGTAFDITDRKLAESKLRENEERFRLLAESSLTGIYLFQDHRFVYVNEAFARIFGYPISEIVGKLGPLDLTHPEDREISIENIRRRIEGEEDDIRYDFRGLRKDGTVIHVEVHGRRIQYMGKIGIIGTLIDISDRMKAESELRRREEQYRQLFENANDAIMVFEPVNEIVLDVNRKACELYGFTREEFIGMSLKSISKDVTQGEERIRTVLEKGSLLNFETTHFGKGGHPIDLLVSGSLVEFAGQSAILSINRDITERKRAEKELEESRALLSSIFEASRDGILLEDEEERILYVNSAYARIFGYDSPSELIGKHVSVVQAPEENERMLEYGRRRLRGEAAPTLYEFRGVRKDGSYTDLEVSVAVSTIGGKRYIISVLRDIAERRETERERKHLEQQLYQIQKMDSVGTLASGIAHDFNNILGIILGHTTLLERSGSDSARYAQSLDAISKATRRGADLVKQLLTFARKTDSTFEPVDIGFILKEMSKLLNETFPKIVQLDFSLPGKIPAIIGDSTQLHQVILNLCVNARDAMPEGGLLSVSASVVRAEQLSEKFPRVSNKEYVCILVSDTGIGMPEHVRDRIFEPFFTTKSAGKGTGLGLAVAHGIVTSHGGYIDVESRLGEGSQFRVYLPVWERVAESSAVTKAEESDIRGGTETVLLVEDEEMLREVARQALTAKGYTVHVAEDGEEGILQFQNHRKEIAVVVSDLGLPRIPGDEVLRRIRGMESDVVIILASGFIDPKVKAGLAMEGIVEFIQKPYTPAELLRLIRRSLDRAKEDHR